jgi:hypothetical protein
MNPFKKRRPIRQAHGKPMPMAQWLAGRNSELVVNRGELQSYVYEYHKAVLVPFIADCIKEADRERRRRVFYRRFFRWLRDMVFGPEQAPVVVEAAHLSQAREEREDAAADQEEATAGEAQPPRTCVVCGSAALEPVNERGGLKCDRGHMIEEPPPDQGISPELGPEQLVRLYPKPETATAALALSDPNPARVMDAAIAEDQARTAAHREGWTGGSA